MTCAEITQRSRGYLSDRPSVKDRSTRSRHGDRYIGRCVYPASGRVLAEAPIGDSTQRTAGSVMVSQLNRRRTQLLRAMRYGFVGAASIATFVVGFVMLTILTFPNPGVQAMSG